MSASSIPNVAELSFDQALALSRQASIRTPFNRRKHRATPDGLRRLVNGRYIRLDPQADKCRAWLRS